MSVLIMARDGFKSTNITEGVKALYDHLISSMDWGSGFLTQEDATEVIKVALTCGFLVPEQAQKEFGAYLIGMGRNEPVHCRQCGEVVFYQHYPRGEEFWYHGPKVHYPAIPANEGPHPVVLWPT